LRGQSPRDQCLRAMSGEAHRRRDRLIEQSALDRERHASR
jgi:hypothetical protein